MILDLHIERFKVLTRSNTALNDTCDSLFRVIFLPQFPTSNLFMPHKKRSKYISKYSLRAVSIENFKQFHQV